ncbi:putative membrane protein [Aliiruegeria haliotis]|uniref:Putative membrane protein n=1 Tax=Aliiruegeria haliotis TaxID=1280846 RepID=A0A2T0RSR8_9RHOB|nr:NnrU family protein [Aliiruegeria haliotis]PRY24201.1 putative membrane protein [Aliiruegeria haliotis]
MVESQGWGEFIAVFAAFLLSHSIPTRPSVKKRLQGYLGPAGFTIAYSLLSLGMLYWLIRAAGRAPYVELWSPAPWQAHVAFTLMALAIAIAALAIGRPNPLSLGGAHDERFDPRHPGIVGWHRHPLLLALLLWSLAHLPANGALAHVLLFGTFAGFSLLGMRLIDRRKRHDLGAVRWQELSSTRRMFHPTGSGLLRLGIGALAYAGLLALHGPVIGIQPAF